MLVSVVASEVMENQSIRNQKMENLVDLPLLALLMVVKEDMAAAEDTVEVGMVVAAAMEVALDLAEALEAEEASRLEALGEEEALEVEDTVAEPREDMEVPEDTVAVVEVVELVVD